MPAFEVGHVCRESKEIAKALLCYRVGWVAHCFVINVVMDPPPPVQIGAIQSEKVDELLPYRRFPWNRDGPDSAIPVDDQVSAVWILFWMQFRGEQLVSFGSITFIAGVKEVAVFEPFGRVAALRPEMVNAVKGRAWIPSFPAEAINAGEYKFVSQVILESIVNFKLRRVMPSMVRG